MITKIKFLAFLAVFSLLLALPAQAGVVGVLNGHADAFGGWTGTAAYDNGGDLVGHLDYAVFTAADFNANFGGAGYAPGDQLVYTYQVFNTGADFVSTEIVGISNPANTIGSFNIGDVAPNSAAFVGGNAQWMFDPTVQTDESSYGLAFSSPQIPIAGGARTINGGASVLVSGIPTPGPNQIPEPTTLLLLIAGSAGIMLSRQKRFK